MKHLILKKKESECHIIYCDSQILFFFFIYTNMYTYIRHWEAVGFFLGMCSGILPKYLRS